MIPLRVTSKTLSSNAHLTNKVFATFYVFRYNNASHNKKVIVSNERKRS